MAGFCAVREPWSVLSSCCAPARPSVRVQEAHGHYHRIVDPQMADGHVLRWCVAARVSCSSTGGGLWSMGAVMSCSRVGRRDERACVANYNHVGVLLGRCGIDDRLARGQAEVKLSIPACAAQVKCYFHLMQRVTEGHSWIVWRLPCLSGAELYFQPRAASPKSEGRECLEQLLTARACATFHSVCIAI